MQLFIARYGYRASNNAASHDELQPLANLGNTSIVVHGPRVSTMSVLLLDLLAV